MNNLTAVLNRLELVNVFELYDDFECELAAELTLLARQRNRVLLSPNFPQPNHVQFLFIADNRRRLLCQRLRTVRHARDTTPVHSNIVAYGGVVGLA